MTTFEILVNVKTLESFSNEKIDWETGNFVDTVDARIQNANLTAFKNNIAPEKRKSG